MNYLSSQVPDQNIGVDNPNLNLIYGQTTQSNCMKLNNSLNLLKE